MEEKKEAALTVIERSKEVGKTYEQHQYFQNYKPTIHVADFVSSRLSGDNRSNNYASWKQQMLCFIECQDLLPFIDGTIPPPQDPNDEKTCGSSGNVVISLAMWRMDRMVKGWILGALDDAVLKEVVKSTTARDVWLTLEKKFEPAAAVKLSPEQRAADEQWRNYMCLYRATLKGKWNNAKRIIDNDPNAITARIGPTLGTCLHIAVSSEKAIYFVKKLVELMSDDLLGVKDENGYTALHVAALTGNTKAAEILVGKRPNLLCVPDKYDNFPVHLAALSAQESTLEFLIYNTPDEWLQSLYSGDAGLKLLCYVIDVALFDVALDLAKTYPYLATQKRPDGSSALQRIVLKESTFRSTGTQHVNFWQRLFIYGIYRVWGIRGIHPRKGINQQALELVKCLCKNMKSSDYIGASAIYADAMLIATRFGFLEAMEVIMETFPEAIYSRDDYSKQSIFHVAVENRCEKVFNLIYQTSYLKHRYSDLTDCNGNTLLHLVAKLAPPHKLNLISGAALQMQRELQWFKEVEKILHPYSRERPNNDGKTAKMVFTEEHGILKAEGEKWMKDTSNSCTIVAALIVTVVFAAAITVPGGNESNTGFPLFSTQSAFIVFAVSDAISLFTSTTSLLMFLSILTSRYAEQDFLYALPKRLSIGLVTLFLSICFMMVAFSATVFMVFVRERAWMLIPVVVLACLPVTSFMLLQFPLLVDVISNTYGRGIFHKHSKLSELFSIIHENMEWTRPEQLTDPGFVFGGQLE